MFQLQKRAEQDRDFIESTWAKLDHKLAEVAVRSREKFPYTTKNGVHVAKANEGISWWTNGFWGGLMWLMYCGSGNEDYKRSAERNEERLDGAFEEFWGLHHDVGFMYHITAGVHYKLTGNELSKKRNMYAACLLASRFHVNGEFIRAWNDEPCVTIIDSMMNIPLLYWASAETGDPHFRDIAMKHADTVRRNHIRADGSVKHIVAYDTESGEAVQTLAGQGYSEDSSWSRGQSWALYGFVLSYIHTGKEEYLDTAKQTAHYFISCVSDDYLPKSDFRAPKEPLLYDMTASACAAAGLLELSRHVSEYEGEMYYNAAVKLLKAMTERFCNFDAAVDHVVEMGTERWTDDPEQIGKTANIPIIYGDYYFAEAIYKLKGFDLLFE